MLAADFAPQKSFRRRRGWPPTVPSVVMVAALTGDHRRDFHENTLLGVCDIRLIGEHLAREAAVLRTLALRTRTPEVSFVLQARTGGVVEEVPHPVSRPPMRARDPCPPAAR